MTLTIVIIRPVANSNGVADLKYDGALENGHLFIKIDWGEGDVKYKEFAPIEKHLTDMLLAKDTTADVAWYLKEISETVLLKYENSNGVQEINNWGV